MDQCRDIGDKGQLLGALLYQPRRKGFGRGYAARRGACRDMAQRLHPPCLLLRIADRDPTRGRHTHTGQGYGHIPRSIRLLAANNRHRPLLHAGRCRAAQAADHTHPARGRGVGHEPRAAAAASYGAHSGRIERHGGRLPRLHARDRQLRLCPPCDAVRLGDAGRCGRGFDRGLARSGRHTRRGVRRCRDNTRRRLDQRPFGIRLLPHSLAHGAVPAAGHNRHRSRQGCKHSGHGSPHIVEDAYGGRRMARRAHGRGGGAARRRGSRAVRPQPRC